MIAVAELAGLALALSFAVSVAAGKWLNWLGKRAGVVDEVPL